jgi:hypothetical protein
MRSPAACQTAGSESIRVRIPSPPLLCSYFNVQLGQNAALIKWFVTRWKDKDNNDLIGIIQ